MAMHFMFCMLFLTNLSFGLATEKSYSKGMVHVSNSQGA